MLYHKLVLINARVYIRFITSEYDVWSGSVDATCARILLS